MHFDEREVARSSKRCARSRRCRMFCARLDGCASHDPCDAQYAKDFGGREVGRSAKSFEVQHVSSTHRLSAKGSRDSSLHVESTRAWRFCGCVRGRATPGPSNARDNAFGWASGWLYNISNLKK